VRVWILQEHSIPLAQHPFTALEQDGDALALYGALPHLVLLYIANDMPGVARCALALLNQIHYWKEERPDILKTIGPHCKRLHDKFIEFHNRRDMGWLNQYGELTWEIFEQITCLIKIRGDVRENVVKAAGIERADSATEMMDLIDRYSRPGWHATNQFYDSWLVKYFNEMLTAAIAFYEASGAAGGVASGAADAMTMAERAAAGVHAAAADGAEATDTMEEEEEEEGEGEEGGGAVAPKHLVHDTQSEKGLGKVEEAIQAVVKKAGEYNRTGGWCMVKTADEVKLAAQKRLGAAFDPTDTKERASTRMKEAGWTVFDHYACVKEEAAGRNGGTGQAAMSAELEALKAAA